MERADSIDSRRRPIILHIVTVVVLLSAIVVGQRLLTAEAPDFDQACRDGEPYFVAAAYRGQSARNRPPDMRAPSVILYHDTPDDRPNYVLSTFNDTGTVWGLAYRRSEPAIYAGAYHKRALPMGRAGAGGIYRIDLATGETTEFATIPDAGVRRRGASMSRGERDYDSGSAGLVGKIALGDLEISEDESTLFVMNMFDRRIHRLEMPSGAHIDSFEHGAMGEAWVENARPMGLAVHDGMLYHGLVNAAGSGRNLVGKVYRSNPDGSEMSEVASIDLSYTRDGIRLRTVSGANVKWKSWNDRAEIRKPGERARLEPPQPMLSDIEFSDGGEMIVGLRDRHWDIDLQYIDEEERFGPTVAVHPATTPTASPPLLLSEEGLGFGDLLLGRPGADGWDVVGDPEFFDDTNQLRHAESAFGGLAFVPGGQTVAATSYGVKDARSETIVGEEGVYWYDVSTGNKTGQEALGNPGSFLDYDALLSEALIARAHTTEEIFLDFEYHRDIASLGDTEVLCVPEPEDVPTVETTPTDTPVVPTYTSVPPTDTPVPPTDTPVPPTDTPAPVPIYLPILLREECDPERVRADVVLVLDASSSMTGEKASAAKAAAVRFIGEMDLPEDQVGVVAFNREGWIVSPLSGDVGVLTAAVDAIELHVGTRIDHGLELAAEVLAGPERIETNRPVVIVLTDGIQDVEAERPQALAAAMRDDGVLLHAIGLGADVDVAYLERLAGPADRLHLSPTAADLADIYARIAREIPCAPESFWGGR